MPIFRGEGSESQEPSGLTQKYRSSMVKLQLELGASGSQLCLKQGSPVDQIQPCPPTYAWTLAAFTLLQLS